jgi:hypothetical protein
MTDKTAIQRIQELDRERAELFAKAKEEALHRATQAAEDLNALCLKYRLVEGELGSRAKLNRAQRRPDHAARRTRYRNASCCSTARGEVDGLARPARDQTSHISKQW